MVGDGAPVLVRRALTESGLEPRPEEALARFLQIYDRRLMNHTVAVRRRRREPRRSPCAAARWRC